MDENGNSLCYIEKQLRLKCHLIITIADNTLLVHSHFVRGGSRNRFFLVKEGVWAQVFWGNYASDPL